MIDLPSHNGSGRCTSYIWIIQKRFCQYFNSFDVSLTFDGKILKCWRKNFWNVWFYRWLFVHLRVSWCIYIIYFGLDRFRLVSLSYLQTAYVVRGKVMFWHVSVRLSTTGGGGTSFSLGPGGIPHHWTVGYPNQVQTGGGGCPGQVWMGYPSRGQGYPQQGTHKHCKLLWGGEMFRYFVSTDWYCCSTE